MLRIENKKKPKNPFLNQGGDGEGSKKSFLEQAEEEDEEHIKERRRK